MAACKYIMQEHMHMTGYIKSTQGHSKRCPFLHWTTALLLAPQPHMHTASVNTSDTDLHIVSPYPHLQAARTGWLPQRQLAGTWTSSNGLAHSSRPSPWTATHAPKPLGAATHMYWRGCVRKSPRAPGRGRVPLLQRRGNCILLHGCAVRTPLAHGTE